MGLFGKAKQDFDKAVANSRQALRKGTGNRVHGAVLATNRDMKRARRKK